MSEGTEGSEFRIDPEITPTPRLLPTQLFVELTGSVLLTDVAAKLIDRDHRPLLLHLPPNPWSPLMKSSYRELQSIAQWAGTVDLSPVSLPSSLPVAWRLQWLAREGQKRLAVLRCGGVIEMKSRAEASAALMRLQSSARSGGALPMCAATVALPDGTAQAFEAQVVRVEDALGLTSLDDDSGETRGLMRQRHMYGETSAVIELWSAGDFMGRTWMLLEQDIIDRFGSLDLAAVEQLIQPDILQGRRAVAKSRDGVVIVSEM